MAKAVWGSTLGSEFDDFLFAPIGDPKNGKLLSVLSALARLGVDPWAEAADLAGMSGQAAARRLASLIAALPDEASSHPDLETVAARLTALLPGRSRSGAPSRKTSIGPAAATSSRPVAWVAIILAVVFGAYLTMSGWSRDPPGENSRTSASVRTGETGGPRGR